MPGHSKEGGMGHDVLAADNFYSSTRGDLMDLLGEPRSS